MNKKNSIADSTQRSLVPYLTTAALNSSSSSLEQQQDITIQDNQESTIEEEQTILSDSTDDSEEDDYEEKELTRDAGDKSKKDSRKLLVLKTLQKLKDQFSYFTVKNKKGRTRGFLQCKYVCPSGPLKGQQCTYKPRFESKRKSYNHMHTFTLDNTYKKKTVPISNSNLTDTLVDIVSTTNMSFRKACSPQFINLLDDCIEYGFSLGTKKKELTNVDRFPRINRNKLKKLTVEKSNNIKEENLRKFSNRDVYLTIDGTKLCHKSTIDVVVYAFSTNGKLESFLLDTYEPKNQETQTYINIGTNSIATLQKYNCRTRAFITDGQPSQRAAYDPANKNSIQRKKGGSYANIFFVYCRCHLINCVIITLITDFFLMK